MEEQLCTVCFVPCTLSCGKCKNVSYCCKEHQTGHWKEHKKDCHPFKIVTLPDKGRVLLATKDMASYSIIIQEQSIINLPNDDEDKKKMGRICVTCGKIMDKDKVSTCSKCSSLVCGIDCESAEIHANYECKVFSKAKATTYIPLASCCNLTSVVRCLLLKIRNKEKYEALMTLQSNRDHFYEDRNEGERFTANSIIVDNILKEVGLQGFNKEDIATVFGIIATNKLTSKTFDKQLDDISLMHLYSKTCLASHSCVSNARPLIQSSGRVKLIATRPIVVGEEITIDYIDSSEGTVERQKKLQSRYYFSCKCIRCQDPTELGTNFSSVKCRQCTSGFLVPKHQWDRNQDVETEELWICNGCSHRNTDAQIQQVLAPLNDQILEIQLRFCKRREVEAGKELQALVDKYSGRVLHPNHYMIFKLEDKFTEIIFLMLYLSKEKSIRSKINLSPQKILCLRTILATKCRKLLEVCDNLFPGPTGIRGQRLFMLWIGMQDATYNQTIAALMSRPLQEKRDIPDSIKEQMAVAEEAVQILSLEPDIGFQGGVKQMKGWISKFQPYF